MPDVRAKTCLRCGRVFEWRKKWSACWEEVRYCSSRCRNTRADEVDVALERNIVSLLRERGRAASICPSEAARAVSAEWRPLMERARMAARRMVAAGVVELTQRGKVVEGSTARGPIRVRLRR